MRSNQKGTHRFLNSPCITVSYDETYLKNSSKLVTTGLHATGLLQLGFTSNCLSNPIVF